MHICAGSPQRGWSGSGRFRIGVELLSIVDRGVLKPLSGEVGPNGGGNHRFDLVSVLYSILPLCEAYGEHLRSYSTHMVWFFVYLSNHSVLRIQSLPSISRWSYTHNTRRRSTPTFCTDERHAHLHVRSVRVRNRRQLLRVATLGGPTHH